MDVSVICPQCKGRLKVPAEVSGKRLRCPKCSFVLSHGQKERTTEVSVTDTTNDEHLDESAQSATDKVQSSSRRAALWFSVAFILLTLTGVGVWASGLFTSAPQLALAHTQTSPTQLSGELKGTPTSSSKDEPPVEKNETAKEREKQEKSEPKTKSQRKKTGGNSKEKHEPGNTTQGGKEQPKNEGQNELIRTAKRLEAPPAYTSGKFNNDIWAFTAKMGKLASDEFEFRDTQKQVFVATFDQRNVEIVPTIHMGRHRNSLFLGTYDFDKKEIPLVLNLWIERWFAHTVGTEHFPESIDICSLTTMIQTDEATARTWRDAYSRNELSFTVWFRFVKVVNSSSKANTHRPGKLAYDLDFRIEVLKIKDETKKGNGPR